MTAQTIAAAIRTKLNMDAPLLRDDIGELAQCRVNRLPKRKPTDPRKRAGALIRLSPNFRPPEGFFGGLFHCANHCPGASIPTGAEGIENPAPAYYPTDWPRRRLLAGAFCHSRRTFHAALSSRNHLRPPGEASRPTGELPRFPICNRRCRGASIATGARGLELLAPSTYVTLTAPLAGPFSRLR
jgi:hypothetical protein